MIDIPLIREQCRIFEDETSDALLKIYRGAALRLIETRTGRKVVDADVADRPENALEFTDDVRLAVLLLIAHWHENTTATGATNLAEVPLGFEALIGPYRWFPS